MLDQTAKRRKKKIAKLKKKIAKLENMIHQWFVDNTQL